MSAKRVFSVEFKVGVAQRILSGESVSALRHELSIKRGILYRWRDAYRKEGAAGLSRPVGRPPGTRTSVGLSKISATASVEDRAAQKMAELERKVGRQALELDFLQRAFRRVKELRQQSGEPGGTASTERSGA